MVSDMNMRAMYAASAAVIAGLACVLCAVVVFAHAPLVIAIAMIASALFAIAIAGGLIGMAVRAGQSS
jgi:hypothetical protein